MGRGPSETRALGKSVGGWGGFFDPAVVVAELSPAGHRLSAGALDRLRQSPLGEHATQMRLVLDRPLKVSLHVDALSSLRSSRLDRRCVQLLAGATRLDALGANGLGASAAISISGWGEVPPTPTDYPPARLTASVRARLAKTRQR